MPAALKSKDSIALFKLHKYMGDAFEHHQQLDQTLKMYAVCNGFIPHHNIKLKSFLLSDSAYTYTLLQDYETATRLTLEALELAQLSKDVPQIITTLTGVAEGFSGQNLNIEAEEYFKKAINLSNSIHAIRLQEYSHRYYAVHLLKVKNPELAFKNLGIALNYSKKLKDSISMAYAFQQWHFITDKKSKLNRVSISRKKQRVFGNDVPKIAILRQFVINLEIIFWN